MKQAALNCVLHGSYLSTVQIISMKRVVQKTILLAKVLHVHLLRWPRQVLRKLQMVTKSKFKSLR